MSAPVLYQPEVYRDCWIQVASGKAFPVLAPAPEDIDINDIAHALSRQCRFGGHVKVEHYSVAQHSVLCSQYVSDPDYALQALLHDAAEAYCVDLPRPIKNCGLIDGYRTIEDGIFKVIAEKFDIPEKLDPSVKVVDVRMLMTEQRDLMGPQVKPWEDSAEPFEFKIQPMWPNEARWAFLSRFMELTMHVESTGIQLVAERRLLHNRARCKICDQVIESRFAHDFVTCREGHIFVDGGRDYIRCGLLMALPMDPFEDLCVYE